MPRPPHALRSRARPVQSVPVLLALILPSRSLVPSPCNPGPLGAELNRLHQQSRLLSLPSTQRRPRFPSRNRRSLFGTPVSPPPRRAPPHACPLSANPRSPMPARQHRQRWPPPCSPPRLEEALTLGQPWSCGDTLQPPLQFFLLGLLKTPISNGSTSAKNRKQLFLRPPSGKSNYWLPLFWTNF